MSTSFLEYVSIVQTAKATDGPIIVIGTNSSSSILRLITFSAAENVLYQPYLVNNVGYVRFVYPTFSV
jgi:hypothetical protein